MSDKAKDADELCEIVEIFREHRGEEEAAGIFGLEEEADYAARQLKLERLKEKIEGLDRGYEGNVRTCPRCHRRSQHYKGDCARRVRVDGGALSIKRAYYVCRHCKAASYPLDERLGLVQGQEQGRLREKMSVLAVLMPYNQAPYVCEVLLSSEVHAEHLRRLLEREAAGYRGFNPEGETTLDVSWEDTVYLEIDGHMCPTREARTDETDQGYREAKIAMAFCDKEIADVSPERKELLRPIFQGRIAPAAEFSADVQAVYKRANAANAKRVVAIADGAKWIWKILEAVAPEAIQILDYAHVKSYLYDAATLIYGTGASLVLPWIKQQQDLLFEDNVEQVIENIKAHLRRKSKLEEILTYLENNKQRMHYGAYQRQGLLIGSGAIESAGKRIAQGRIKGCGMRWNIPQANQLIQLRCAFFDGSWKNYWSTQRKLAA